jgi:hypothetical protein
LGDAMLYGNALKICVNLCNLRVEPRFLGGAGSKPERLNKKGDASSIPFGS